MVTALKPTGVEDFMVLRVQTGCSVKSGLLPAPPSSPGPSLAQDQLFPVGLRGQCLLMGKPVCVS